MDLEKCGRYEIRSEIGFGGMARVYRAHDPLLKRDVAVKVIQPEFLFASNFLTRFRREAEVIAGLSHEAIVPIYDYGEESGLPYLVMPLFSGGTLADSLKRGPVGVQEAVRLGQRLSSALDYAHARGVIHRDLKPGNVLFDQQGQPYLSDFGLVKMLESDLTDLTSVNKVLGTPAYMSPEQWGDDEPLDGRADLYALGVVVFQMLTGQLPYQANTPAAMMRKHVAETIPRIHALKPDLPASAQVFVDRAMAKKKEARYQTGAELAAAMSSLTNAGGHAPAAIGGGTTGPGELRRPSIRLWALGGIAGLFFLWGVAFIVNVLGPGGGEVTRTPTSSATTVRTATAMSTATVRPTSTIMGREDGSPTVRPPTPTVSPALPSASPTASRVTPTAAATRTATRTRTRTPVPAPRVISPAGQTLQSPITFRWAGAPGIAYQVTVMHGNGQHSHQSDWILGDTWTLSIPGEQFGGWTWLVVDEYGSRSDTGWFTFDPFPQNNGPPPSGPANGGDPCWNGYPPPTPCPPTTTPTVAPYP